MAKPKGVKETIQADIEGKEAVLKKLQEKLRKAGSTKESEELSKEATELAKAIQKLKNSLKTKRRD